MVTRPPPGGGAQSKSADADMWSTSSSRSFGNNSIRGHPRRGLEWSLRSMHSIDTGKHHFLSDYHSSYEDFGQDSVATTPTSGTADNNHENAEHLEDQSAYEIFKSTPPTTHKANDGATMGVRRARDSIWAPVHAPLRTGIVDGKKVVFELLTNVTQPPTTPRAERMELVNQQHAIIHAKLSSLEIKMRLWLMHFSLGLLSAVFLASFLAMNIVYALLFYYLADGRCCGDDSLTFGQVFSFCVQTSTTIGYGSMSPTGYIANCLVVCLSYGSTLMNTIFAGLLFARYVTPVCHIQFSEVMTLCNVNGVPCLNIRLGNADGPLNPLTDINVRLTYAYRIPYTDHNGQEKYFAQTEELKLLSNRQHGLVSEVWTLRHVLDEASPLFGLHLSEHPANKIHVFTLSIDAIQNLTKAPVNLQIDYGLEDILIGHNFVDLVRRDDPKHPQRAVSDFSLLSGTEPYPVWYPAQTGAYDTSGRTSVKSFKP